MTKCRTLTTKGTKVHEGTSIFTFVYLVSFVAHAVLFLGIWFDSGAFTLVKRLDLIYR
jgi:hypothetical protein